MQPLNNLHPMKNRSQIFLFSLLLAGSLGSYGFLHLQSRQISGDPVVLEAEEEARESEVLLPDIRLAKKAVELGRKIVEIAQ